VHAHIGDRRLFPSLADRVYANHASIGPIPEPARVAASQAMSEVAAEGAGAIRRWLPTREATRAAIERLIGAAPGTVAMVQNTTAGVVHVAAGTAWRPGDRVVVFTGEFPTNVLPWHHAAARFGAAVVSIPARGLTDGTGDGLAALELALGRGVRMVAVSAVQFQTGHRVALEPLITMCHAAGAEVFVDAIQAVGATPIDVAALGVDWLASGGHKWLMAGPGAGFLYARPGRAAALDPLLSGWLSVEDAVDFLFAPDLLRYDKPLRGGPERFEGAMGAFAAEAALGASARLLLEVGVEATFAHANAWHDRVAGPLEALGFVSHRSDRPEHRSAILSLAPPPGVRATDLAAGLAARGVAVATPEGNLRLSPSWPNALDEAAVVVDAIRDVLAGVPVPARPPATRPRLAWRSAHPDRATGWAPASPDVPLTHPAYGALHHVWVEGPDGQPRWDQPAWSEPVGAITVPILPDGRLFFVRQHRPIAAPVGATAEWPKRSLSGAGADALELPRGFARVGEAPEHAARREAEEETGHEAVAVAKIGEANPNSTFFFHAIPIFRVTLTARAASAVPDEHEHLVGVPMTRAEVAAAIRDGRIGCGLTLAALACLTAHDTQEHP
jgi:cysteine desulfurase/selenocysteine lyase